MGKHSIRDRYVGTGDGRRRLVAALCDQRLVENNETIAKAVAAAGTVMDFQPGALLVEQGGGDTDVYLILDGTVDVLVNDRLVARRGPRESIGEMIVTDTTTRRSATVKATTSLLALKLTEPKFSALAAKFPTFWKSIAKIVAERLRERNKFHRPPNPLPVLFVGSSIEGLALANELVVGLKFDQINVRVWNTPGVFSPSGVSIDVLMKEIDCADFAGFVFGPDDKIVSRKQKYYAPRDNVVFELGMFMGTLERARTFIISEYGANIKIPSDLLGVTPVTYVRKTGQDLAAMLVPVCIELRKTITNLGVR
jgi:CRP/FNR family cyclic AMP-dependent transcriptional regulator